MKKRYLSFSIVFICFFSYGLLISQFKISIIPDELKQNHPDGYFDYKGVMNVHSKLSSGSGSIQHIIREAQSLDLNFISITDLNLNKKPKQYEGYHDGLYVFIDAEYSYLNSRLLNYNASKNEVLLGAGRRQVFLSDHLEKSKRDKTTGIFVLSHPFKPGYEWPRNFPPGLNGMEILNLKSMWENMWLHSTPSFVWTLFIYPFNPDFAFSRLFEYPEKEIKLWDKLNKSQKVLGFSGTDAEEKIVLPKGKFLKIPNYNKLFQIVSNHVLLPSELTGDPSSDAKRLKNAINKGNFYFSLDLLANPKGFISYVVTKNSEQYLMGDEFEFEEEMSLYIKLPQKPMVPFDVTIYKDGQKILTSKSIVTKYRIHLPGNYRVYVRVRPNLPPPDGRKWLPWIFTNHFHIKSPHPEKDSLEK